MLDLKVIAISEDKFEVNNDETLFTLLKEKQRVFISINNGESILDYTLEYMDQILIGGIEDDRSEISIIPNCIDKDPVNLVCNDGYKILQIREQQNMIFISANDCIRELVENGYLDIKLSYKGDTESCKIDFFCESLVFNILDETSSLMDYGLKAKFNMYMNKRKEIAECLNALYGPTSKYVFMNNNYYKLNADYIIDLVTNKTESIVLDPVTFKGDISEDPISVKLTALTDNLEYESIQSTVLIYNDRDIKSKSKIKYEDTPFFKYSEVYKEVQSTVDNIGVSMKTPAEINDLLIQSEMLHAQCIDIFNFSNDKDLKYIFIDSEKDTRAYISRHILEDMGEYITDVLEKCMEMSKEISTTNYQEHHEELE